MKVITRENASITLEELEAARTAAHRCLNDIYDANFSLITWKGNFEQSRRSWNDETQLAIMKAARIERSGVVDEKELSEAFASVRASFQGSTLTEETFWQKIYGMFEQITRVRDAMNRAYTARIHGRLLLSMNKDARPFTMNGRTAATAHLAAKMAIDHMVYIVESANIENLIDDFIEDAIRKVLSFNLDYDEIRAGIDIEFSRAAADISTNKVATSTPPTEGPWADKFYWNGKPLTIQPKDFQLLSTLWNKSDHTETFDEIDNKIWSGDARDTSIPNAVKRLQTALSNTSMTISQKQGKVVLEVTSA